MDTGSHQLHSEPIDQVEYLRSILDDLQLWLLRYKPDGTIVYINRAFCDYLGSSEAEILGTKIQAFVRDSNFLDENHILSILNPPPNRISNYAGEQQNGNHIWREWIVHPVTDQAQQVQEYQLTIRDISDQKKAEDFIRRSAMRTEYLLNSSSTIIYSCHASEPFAPTYITRNVEHILGCKQTDFLSDNLFWVQRIHPSDRDDVLATELPASGEQVVQEYRFRHQNNAYIWLRDEKRIVENEDGDLLIMGAWMDVTQRKHAEATRLDLTREITILEERQRLAGDLHDAITQTLFSSSVIAEALTHMKEKDPEKAWDSLEELRRLNRGALAEMRNLLLELRWERLRKQSMTELLQQLADAAMGASMIDVEVKVKVQDEVPPDLRAAFYRITKEALQNAVRFSEARQAIVTLEQDQQDKHWILTISDNGQRLRLTDSHVSWKQIRDQAATIQAACEIASTDQAGTRIRVVVSPDE